jgi:predicted transcriptional regulator
MIDPTTATFAAFLLMFAMRGMVRQMSTRQENLIKQPRREQIITALRKRPGAHISELCRDLDTAWGTLQHHLQLLKRAGLVRSVVAGRDHQFYVADVKPENLGKLALVRRGRVPELVAAIMRRPGIIQRELVEELEMHRKVMRRYLDLLKSEGLIKETRVAKNRLYYPMPPLEGLATELLMDRVSPSATPLAPIGAQQLSNPDVT